MKQGDIPLGLGMALAQHPDALEKFAKLSDSQREKILQQAHTASSKREMQAIVSNIGASM